MLESRLFLQASIESPVGIIIMAIDAGYRYLYCNTTHKNAMKYSYGKDVEIGMNILDCISSEEDRLKAKNNYDRALKGEAHSTIEVYGEQNKSYFESFYSPIFDERKEIIGITAYAIDITEHRNAEEELRKNEIINRIVVDQSPIAIEVFDSDGVLKSANPACLEMLGIQDVKELSLVSLFTDPNITEDYKNDLANHKTIRYQTYYNFDLLKNNVLHTTTRTGQAFFDVIITPIENSSRIISGYILHIQDLSER